MSDDLQKRLEMLLGQLRKAEASCAFGGAGTSVRVKDAPYLIEQISSAATEIRRLNAELDMMKAVMADPVAVHVNMLRGSIAKPSPAAIVHLYGEAKLIKAMPWISEALAPFAELAASLNDCDQHPDGCPDGALVDAVEVLTVGDFRRAAAALGRISAGEGE